MVSKTVANWEPTEADLDSIESIQDYLEMARQNSVEVSDASSVIGDGYAFVEDKNTLVGVPFLIVKFDFGVSSKNERRYVNAWVITQDGRKLKIFDQSTGILDQLTTYSAKSGKYTGVACKHGLNKSEYTIEVENKKTGELEKQAATTFYLDVS